MRKRLNKHLSLGCGAFLLLLSIGCRPQESQADLETQLAGIVVRSLALLEIEAPGQTITNMEPAFKFIDLTRSHRDHPYLLQQRFRKFGSTAGFRNSIYEKYIPISVTNLVEGVPLSMSSIPFPNETGQAVRTVLWKQAPLEYRYNAVPENRVQKILHENAAVLSDSPSLPQPPIVRSTEVPLSTRLRIYCRDVALDLGLPRSGWWLVPVAYTVAFLLAVANGIVTFRIFARR